MRVHVRLQPLALRPGGCVNAGRAHRRLAVGERSEESGIAARRLRAVHVQAHAWTQLISTALGSDKDRLQRPCGGKLELVEEVEQQAAPRAHLGVRVVHEPARRVPGHLGSGEALRASAQSHHLVGSP